MKLLHSRSSYFIFIFLLLAGSFFIFQKAHADGTCVGAGTTCSEVIDAPSGQYLTRIGATAHGYGGGFDVNFCMTDPLGSGSPQCTNFDEFTAGNPSLDWYFNNGASPPYGYTHSLFWVTTKCCTTEWTFYANTAYISSTHLACQSNACTTVGGGGPDKDGCTAADQSCGTTPPPLPTADVKCNGTDGPCNVTWNTNVSISWSSADADDCTLDGVPVDPNGGTLLFTTTSNHTYSLSCTGPGGGPATDQAVVNVGPSYSSCQGNSCVRQAGSQSNSCATSPDCISPPPLGSVNLNFFVTSLCDSSGIAGASVNISQDFGNGTNRSTDGSGYANFGVPQNTSGLGWSVAAAGYSPNPKTGSVSIVISDVDVPVSLTPVGGCVVTGGSHLACVSNACRSVAGAGADGCQTNADCGSTSVACTDAASATFSAPIPATVYAGQTISFTTQVGDTGNTRWYHPAAYGFYQFSSPMQSIVSTAPVPGYDHGVAGGSGLYPGDTIYWTFNLTAPATPGVYNFVMQMVHGAGQDYLKPSGATCSGPGSDTRFGQIASRSFTVKNTPVLPIGWMDTTDCTHATGWTCDADNYNQPLNVQLYNGDPAAGGTYLGVALANVTREPAVAAACGGNADHGYDFDLSSFASIHNNASHDIFAYAVDIGGPGGTKELSGAPKSTGVCPVVACSGGEDIGLKLYQNGVVRKIAVEPLGSLVSPLRIYKGAVRAIMLTDPDPANPNVSKMVVQTPAGIKAYCLLP